MRFMKILEFEAFNDALSIFFLRFFHLVSVDSNSKSLNFRSKRRSKRDKIEEESGSASEKSPKKKSKKKRSASSSSPSSD